LQHDSQPRATLDVRDFEAGEDKLVGRFGGPGEAASEGK
jgi:hypothetical protein